MKRAIRFTIGKSWKLLLVDLGLNPTSVLKLAGLPLDLFVRKESSLNPEEYFRLFKSVEDLASRNFGKDMLPLMVGDAISFEMFDPPIFAALCSSNLLMALRRISEYKPLVGPMNLRVYEDTEIAKLSIDCIGYADEIPKTLAMIEAVFFTQIARLATRHQISPLKVCVPSIPKNIHAYRQFFGSTVLEQHPMISITFSKSDALRPFLTEDAGMWSFFERDLKRRLHELDHRASMIERVESLLFEMLPSGLSSMEEVASRLALSKRTLQRRLKEEETSYQNCLQTVREKLARHYLSESLMSQAEISFLLGFNDTNSFTRAYSSWTGEPPGQYRSRVAPSAALAMAN